MSKTPSSSLITIVGATEHNLQNLSLTLPRDALTVFTGVSGSGKSSLAFDTLYKEGQRRFLESLSPYARQFLGQMEKPKVEHVEGLSPTISIDQKTVNRNPRSTVGTTTELYDYFRLLFARLGQPHCPKCQVPISTLTPEQISDRMFALFGKATDGPQCMVLAPMVRERKGEYRKELTQWLEEGYVRARIDGEVRRLDETIELARYEKHTLELVLDRFTLESRNRSRLAEAVEKGLTLSGGLVVVQLSEEDHLFSSSMACPDCQLPIPELEPRLFSFNDPQGACGTCNGLGMLQQYSESRVTHNDKTIEEGAFACFTAKGNLVFTHIEAADLVRLAKSLKISTTTPWGKLPLKARTLLLEGNDTTKLRVRSVFRNPDLLWTRARKEGKWAGLYQVLAFIGRFVGTALERYQDVITCPDCLGLRLGPVALAVRFHEQTIDKVTGMGVSDACHFFEGLSLDETEELIGRDIFREIKSRLRFLEDVGVGYLTLDRRSNTLSGGESQRIRLASQVGSGLQGVLYILDEPSIGLHQTDNRKLIQTLQRLRDTGNTVCVVEHDHETIASADHVVDMGPGAGSEGGHILAQGTPAQLARNKASLSGQYLKGTLSIPVPLKRRKPQKTFLTIHGAKKNNLSNLDVKIPLGLLVAVTGVSGSGKSTLVHEILKKNLAHHFAKRPLEKEGFKRMTGLEHVDKVIEIDQSPIGRTPRSNPATYTKVFDLIRALFSGVPEASIRGYKPGRFSFNVKGGRCEACQGAGIRTVEMQFLSNVEVVCEECNGKRFNEETLQIHYKGRSIIEVLEMTVAEAQTFFANIPAVVHILSTLSDVGLGYIHLGQPSTTLSGGEAQRVKLASELRKKSTGQTLYLLDEPTTGLHFHDVSRLLECLNALVEQGNTVLVIEHNLDVVKVADWVIDLGPGGGKHGGQLVAQGTPEKVATQADSLTGQVLAETLKALPILADNKPKNGGPVKDLIVRGAEQHNLKRIDVTIPRDKLTVVTGVSGSGKTSLAFDTIFAEGQARYVESLSTYARRFLGRMDKAHTDGIEGLAPAIAIDQKSSGRSPRSTVATITEMYDYLRLLYARIGQPHCPKCGQALQGYSPTTLAREVTANHSGERLIITAPLYRPKSKHAAMLDDPKHFPELATSLISEGFTRVLVGGESRELDDWAAPTINKGKALKLKKEQILELVIDRVSVNPNNRKRLAESFETGFERGHGLICLHFPDATHGDKEPEARLVSQPMGCVDCDYYQEEPLTPRMFSFNSHVGACPECTGLGIAPQIDAALLVPFPDQPLLEGALSPGPITSALTRKNTKSERAIRAFAKREGINLKNPFGKLSPDQQKHLIFGDGKQLSYTRKRGFGRGTRSINTTFEGLAGVLLGWYQDPANAKWAPLIQKYMADVPCEVCEGDRLRPAYRAVTLSGLNISEFCALTVTEAAKELDTWKLKKNDLLVAEQPLQEIRARLKFLVDVGLDYLNLNRAAATLSGGEAQRIRLASQLGAHLVGVLYVLDEPTIGLHPRDTGRLLGTLQQLKERGNTVIVVEHDTDTIMAADHVLDMGPGAGHRGGEVVAACAPEKLLKHAKSLTGAYLSGKKTIEGPEKIRKPSKEAMLRVKGAKANNLKNINVDFPLSVFTAVTGVSGSGKSSLVVAILQRALQRQLGGERVEPGPHKKIEGLKQVDKLVVVDQSPIGKTPKSNPATYTKVMDDLRKLFSSMPEAQVRGYKPGRFSFNVKGGRCEACEGRGFNHVEMHFLADVWVPCELCDGRRYNRETLQIYYRGKNIADILEMEISEAAELLARQPRLQRRLQTLEDVGLGYMKLGQSANTLSGGEAQRVKLAAELGVRGTGRTVYLLDEPTVGLHMDDIAKLLKVLHRLVEEGNTVVVIEHNLDVIATADHIIDLGPEGGDKGGEMVAKGTPQALKKTNTHTGRALASHSSRLG